ncbi:MAG: 3'(2'),5'-bisphosphate nucleotidase CysQ [Planctomycetes bacterium]|nr:3'(2'),5'-bisphosphate nucleotidase CysQ [Planctomycetota bacterium]
MDYGRELQAALEAARLAGEALLEQYERFQKIADAPIDISTEADRISQEIVLKCLRRHFPEDALCAEEETPTLAAASRTGQRLWVVDPIDGTRGFARKNGEFSVMVAFLDQGQIGVGVVLEPAHGRLTYAHQGGGCWRQDQPESEAIPCRVSQVADLARAALVQSRSKNPETPSPPVQAIKPARVLETYSAGIKLVLVARGEADLYVNTYEAFHDWDICAGQLLVEEAGGKVTGLKGETIRYGLPGAWQRQGLLASNGNLHEPALLKMTR